MLDKKLTKRLTSVKDFRRYVTDAVRDFSAMRQGLKSGLVTPALRDKIMLAVTEVNGCRYCSYMHAKNAIKSGIQEYEIEALLSGDLSNATTDEATALLFAQHYAETLGKLDQKTLDNLYAIYGEDKGRGILATTRAIMVGNVHGIAIDLLQARLRGKKDPESSIATEAAIAFGVLVFLPAALLKKLFGLQSPDMLMQG